VRAAARLAALLIALVVLAALAVAVAGLSARPAPADAALVFGNTVQTNGEPSPRLAARLDAALDLKQRGLVRWIVVSGGRGREGFDEAAVMKQQLVDAGIADSAVIVDSGGVNTHATTRNARRLLAARGGRSVDVVTQWFHVPRARLAAQMAGLDVRGAAYPRFFEPRDLYSLLREVAAFPAYLLRGSAARPRTDGMKTKANFRGAARDPLRLAAREIPPVAYIRIHPICSLAPEPVNKPDEFQYIVQQVKRINPRAVGAALAALPAAAGAAALGGRQARCAAESRFSASASLRSRSGR